MILRFLIGAFLVVSVASCENGSVSEDVAQYCNCKNELSLFDSTEECDLIIEDIVVKYEYDPEALVEIQRLLQECN